MSQTKIIVSFLGLSTAGGILLIIYTTMAPTYVHTVGIPERIVVSGVFITSCIFGISFTLRPNWLRFIIAQEDDKSKNHIERKERPFRGHHPDCKIFEAHRLTYHNKTWCSGCLGLLVGCLLSILLMVLYVLFPIHLSQAIQRFMVFLGLVLIAIVYIEVVRRTQRPIIHVLTNALLALSFFLITVGVVELSGKVEYGLFTILLCMLWLDTRIRLSKWHHNRLCRSCSEPCKIYAPAITSL